jgi:L-threonylcarbamoyladenylate synthase
LLRPGLLPLPELEAILGPMVRAGTESGTTAMPAPGMLARHYAPRTPLTCHETEPAVHPEGCIVVRFGPGELLPGDPDGAASQLYALLHDLDHQGWAGIHVVLPPDTPEWLAIRDRLSRAAH